MRVLRNKNDKNSFCRTLKIKIVFLNKIENHSGDIWCMRRIKMFVVLFVSSAEENGGVFPKIESYLLDMISFFLLVPPYKVLRNFTKY